MSRDGSITLTWGDGEHRFRLPIGQLRELQEKCGAGPPEILHRLATARWRVDDIRETLRLGLIGGGMGPVEALRLMQNYVDPPERPWLENAPMAQAVLMAAMVGVPDEEPVETVKKKTETTIQPDDSSSPPFTEPPPQSGSAPEKSTNGHFGNTSQ